MAEAAHSFDDSDAYERFMGQWTRAVGGVFLDWIESPANADWLDVGCGTGIFTELVLDKASPASVSAIDPAPAQIDHARRRPVGQRANFSVADAQALPFAEASFDGVTAALVVNFVPDPPRALSEMHRVLRPGGLVAAYVWDFEMDLSPSGPLRNAMRRVGAHVPDAPGTNASSLSALNALFERAAFERIATRTIDVSVPFSDFDAFWQAQTPSYSPIGKAIAAMTATDRTKLVETLRAALPVAADGTIRYSARANAIKARRAQ